jgi:hypothetical protein
MHSKFWSENLKGRDHLEDLSEDKMIILGCNYVNWLHLFQDTDQWHAIVGTVMNLRIHKVRKISLTGRTLAQWSNSHIHLPW